MVRRLIILLLFVPIACMAQFYNVEPNINKVAYSSKIYRSSPVNHHFVKEDRPRTANRTISFTGTITYADASKADDTGNGLTPATAKKTITAAIAANSSGGIVQLADGTYLTSAEAGGYLLLNTTGKKILIRGNLSNRSAVIIQQNASASFCIRFRDCGETILQNIKITDNQNNPTIYQDQEFANRIIVFDSCILENTNIGTQTYIFTRPQENNNNPKWVEFKNCAINYYGAKYPLNIAATGNASTFLFTNCSINAYNGNAMNIIDGNLAYFYFYNNTITSHSNIYPFIIGQDTNIPTGVGAIDLRENTVSFSDNYYGHGLLIGRGTNLIYIVNNNIFVSPVDNSLSIGMAVKTVSSNVATAVIKGNYVVAPRPFYIKGGTNTTTSNNTFISNAGAWEAFGIVNWHNGADEVLSRNNIFINNNLISNGRALCAYVATGESEDIATTFKTCTLNYNKYYYTTYYMFDQYNGRNRSWKEIATFWENTNDNQSLKKAFNPLPIKK